MALGGILYLSVGGLPQGTRTPVPVTSSDHLFTGSYYLPVTAPNYLARQWGHLGGSRLVPPAQDLTLGMTCLFQVTHKTS